MSRTTYPFYCSDISALARSLKEQWQQEQPPGHLQIMNMLAKSAGFANFQHLRASIEQDRSHEQAEQQLPPTVRKLLRHFDDSGRLLRWPHKFSEQAICLWAAWDCLPDQGTHPEALINDVLRQCQSFNDHVLLRRELVNHKLMARTEDCRQYWKLGRDIPADIHALLQILARRRSRQAAN